MRFAIGGAGGVNNSVLGFGGATFVDLDLRGDSGGRARRNINGRVINPPFMFGAGALELLAKEMTRDLNEQLRHTRPGKTRELRTHGVDFGRVTRTGGGRIAVDGDGRAVGVEGVFDPRPYVDGRANPDFLVVAPFGRKGDNKSLRTFDEGALLFHFGMAVDGGRDHDDDGVVHEVTAGELSALGIFIATLQRPHRVPVEGKAARGRALLEDIGCTACHIPAMHTESPVLTLSTPEIGNDPDANVFYGLDMSDAPMDFKRSDRGGIVIELFADLKRHDMGDTLAEFNGDAMFTTARLWGVADTAPYLHDGRALTIRDAIVMHGAPGSEAADAVAAFLDLDDADQDAILAFLNTLRSSRGGREELDDVANELARKQDVDCY
jgi:hypothetical protein